MLHTEERETKGPCLLQRVLCSQSEKWLRKPRENSALCLCSTSLGASHLNRFDWQELRFKTCPPHLQHIKINQQLSCRPCILQNTCNKSNNSSLYKPSIPICACYRLHSSTSSKPLACSNAPFHAFWKQVSGNTPTIRFYHLSFYTNTRETGQNPFYWKHIC